MQLSKQYQDIVQKIHVEQQEPEWMLKKRHAALHYFMKEPMPNFIYGLNINLNVDLDLEKLEIGSEKKIARKITNTSAGIFYNKELFQKKELEFKEHFMSSCVPMVDKFTAFHATFCDEFLLIIIPANETIEKPIEIDSVIPGGTHFDHMVIIAQKNSKATIVEKISSFEDSKSYVSKLVEVYVEDNAQLDYGNLQELNDQSFQMTIKRAVVGRDALVNWLDCCFGSKTTLSEVTSLLNDSGAQTNNHGIFSGTGDQQFDLVNKSIHRAPNTISDIFTKGILQQKSKCLYIGLVKIEQNAGNSNGYQKQDTLLLSPEAAADSIPNLEIDNSEVRCTHGATIGKSDPEKLFYLQSRGLSKDIATREYVKGFFEPLIAKMKIAALRENMHDLLDERMGN